MAIVTAYECASGAAFDRCSFLGLRYDDRHGYQPGESEWWVMTARPGPNDTTIRYQYGADRWFTGLWRSPADVTYVADAVGDVHINDDLDAEDSHELWNVHPLGVPLAGIWGLDDDCVFAWGGTFDGRFPLFRWDGSAWTEMANPGFDVRSMHGSAPDEIWAGGLQGALARWDGATWQRIASPVTENVTSIFVVSADEQYATGHRGSLLQGSPAGWNRIAQGPVPDVPLHAVAKWNGELWVGGGQLGLFRRVGATDRLELLKPNLHATALDARGLLVITCPELLAGTEDGQSFFATADDFLLNGRAGRPLRDFTL